MNVLTESFLKKYIQNNNTNIINLKEKDILTPLAKDYVKDKNINIIYERGNYTMDDIKYKEQRKVNFKERIENKGTENEYKYKFITVFGAKLDHKPEHMTHLRGNLLVFKNHKQIIFRGKMDTLEAKILETQILCKQKGKEKLIEDLQSILSFVRNITRSEVLNTPLEEINLLGLNESQIREISHNPKEHFGIGHEFPDYRMGDLVVYINSIRTLVRETELSAYEAFKDEYGNVSRNDIIRALNRLSSVCWIIMFKIRKDEYL